ncbi:uncharacterized protein EAE97_005017 [Botrytis byssoidea]|uniref:Uncharacterized protein n=1 Tax=Botrytis byssoidea TaxID=139641 RepID=A0A9P5LVQ9_9HELO|nr:uncharacterized protein EAE97_005017 [Botrytis byssoidea]KAF7945979.1 hypothetical protein EAE97_005017 [Botrytis byssoidea]
MMNWAIIAREDRLYKGKTLYKWDVSPGLEHHCGTCATPLHNARSKSSCLGKHVEPCFRFHQQLHFLGKSHECLGCNTSDEMHYTRHKEILAIIREITTFDQTDLSFGSQMMKRKDGADKKRTESETTSEATDAISEMSLEEEILTRRERKRAKKLGAKTRRNVVVCSQDEINGISEALHGQIHESKGAWEGTYAYDNRRADTSSATAGPVGEEDEKYDAYAVQPPTPVSNKQYKTPNFPTPKQQRAAKRLNTVTPLRQSKLRGHQQRFTPETAYKNDPYGGIDPEIFGRLGIDVKPSSNPKPRKELIEKLIAAIQNDLHVIRKEEEEAVIREEGFWRWAGRNAFRNILEYRKMFDWATGQKITPGQKMIAMRSEAELFGTEADNSQIDDETEGDNRQDGSENEGEVAADEDIPAGLMGERQDIKEMAHGSEDKFVDEEKQKVKKNKVLRISTAHESHIRPKSKQYKSISNRPLGKNKNVYKRFETEGFADASMEEDGKMEQEGIDDLVEYSVKYGSNTLKSTSTWASVVGYSTIGTTSPAKKGKKVITDRTIVPPPLEEDEWITVTKKGRKN